MQKFLIILFSILFIGCCNKPEYLKNGLTKKTNRVTEYTIRIKKDSLKNSISDTLLVVEKEFNSNNQIIYRFQKSFIDNDTIVINYRYDKDEKIIKEIVKYPNDNSNFIVNYFYKDSLLEKTISEGKNQNLQFKQIGKYYYDQHKLEKISTEFIFLDPESKDTVSHKIEISNYNKDKIETQYKFIDLIHPERNEITKFNYHCGLLEEEIRFDRNKSIITKIKYQYKFDDFHNWIKRESYENGNLNYIKIRDIEYN